MLRVGTGCSGIGSPEQALKNLGVSHSLEFAIEKDKFARQTFLANFDPNLYPDDITQIDYNKLPDIDLFIAGFPCFPKGNLITTSEGLKDISEVNLNDMILTHNKRFKPVINLMKKHKKGVFNLKVKGIPEFKVTEEHPFYCVERSKKWDNSLRRYVYNFSEPQWVKTNNLTKDHFIAIGISSIAENKKALTQEECWLIGRYIADGFIRNNQRLDRKNSFNNQVIFGIGKHKLKEFKENIKTYYVGYVEERTSIKCKIINKRLMDLCLACGKGAKNKSIPDFIMNLPADLLETFLKGYLSGDGGQFKNVIRAVSISEKLIYQLGQIITKLYKKHYTILKTITPDTTVIEGRTVNQNDYWSVQYRESLQRKYFYEKNGFIWVKVSKKEYNPEFQDFVYNFEVEDDNSYVCNNLVVHNCQAFSVAGNRAGFQDPRGTIFFNILELLKAKKPEVFILENVPGLLSHDSGKTFETIISLLSNEVNGCPVMFPNPDSLGYNVHYTTLNTKDFGIPQNRERLFIVGFKNPFVYKSPDKNPSNLKLRDLLEDNVPEKYFLSDEMVKSLLKNADSQKSKGNVKTISFADINQDFESKAILSNYAKMGTTQTYIKTKSLPQAQRINDINSESVTLSSQGGGMGAKTGLYAIPVLTPDKLIKRQNGRRFKEDGDPSFTLTSQDRHGIYDGFRVRRLTPLECFRLQGFPDSFIKPCSDSQLYKQAGNSMTVQVMEALIKSILDIKGLNK